MTETGPGPDAEPTAGARPTVVGVVGPSGAGKTSLIERLVEAFADAGARPATVKSIHHPIEPDDPGTDTHRHRTAGAAATTGITPRHAFEVAPIDGVAGGRDGDAGRDTAPQTADSGSVESGSVESGSAESASADARKRAAFHAAVRRYAAAGYDPILVEGFAEVPIPTVRVGDPGDAAGETIARGEDPLPEIVDAIRSADSPVPSGRPDAAAAEPSATDTHDR